MSSLSQLFLTSISLAEFSSRDCLLLFSLVSCSTIQKVFIILLDSCYLFVQRDMSSVMLVICRRDKIVATSDIRIYLFILYNL